MNIIGVDDQWAITATLEDMLAVIDPDGQHRFYNDPNEVINDIDKPVDTAFLDIEMPKKNGVELAKLITRHHPHCSIIFLTGHSEYMKPAFDIHASGYLLKPFSLDMLKDALDHRRYRSTRPDEKPIKVQCFGSFEVFTKNIPVQFSRKKTKELFAFLIDCKGEKCDVDTIIKRMEPTAVINRSARSQIRVFLSDLTRTFENMGIYDILLKEDYTVGINMSLIDCDYYRLLDGDTFARSQYMGKYMIQYEFVENTRVWLFDKYLKK